MAQAKKVNATKKKTSALKKKVDPKLKKKVVSKAAIKPKSKTAVKSKSKTAVKAKSKKVSPVPKGYNTVTPYLIVDNGASAIEFYKKAFGAKEVMRMDSPNGKVGHAELKIGDSKIMLGDACPESGARSPKEVGGSSVGIHLYLKDVDAVVQRAVAAGAKLTRPVEDQFYGDRSGGLEDPYGHNWYVSTHIEDVSPAKMKKRAAEMYGNK